jgi:hypothetical protein
MSLPPWVGEMLVLGLQLSHWQQLGLAFLLGSFTVATWSDLKYLAAQREFLEVWLFFLLAVLIHDAIQVHAERLGMGVTALKWCLLLAMSLLSLRQVGILFRLAVGDVAALAAGASRMSPVLIVIYFLAAKGFALLLGPALARGRAFYPFMPVVTLATLTVLGLGLLLNGARLERPVDQRPPAQSNQSGTSNRKNSTAQPVPARGALGGASSSRRGLRAEGFPAWIWPLDFTRSASGLRVGAQVSRRSVVMAALVEWQAGQTSSPIRTAVPHSGQVHTPFSAWASQSSSSDACAATWARMLTARGASRSWTSRWTSSPVPIRTLAVSSPVRKAGIPSDSRRFRAICASGVWA